MPSLARHFNIKMVKIYNSDLTKGLAKNAGIQQSKDKTPDELAEKIVPVCETNPELLRKVTIIKSVDISGTSASTGPLYTTPTNQDFYLCGFEYSLIKNAACDNATALKSMSAVVNGETIIITKIGCLTLTAQSEYRSEDFNRPIKLDRGSNINYTNMTTTAGELLRHMKIYGYVDECSNS